MLIILDNGHGNPPLTGGKCSPDKRLLEYEWAREITGRIAESLKQKGVASHILVAESVDIPLKTRVSRTNALCKQYGTKNCLLVSVHVNAANGDGKWHDARGWSGWVAPNASAKSKAFAQMLYAEAEKRGLKGNRCVPAQRYWVGNFSIIRNTNCPAVLTENLFQDNKADVDYLLSEQGKQTIVDIHVDAILKYIKDYE